MAKLKAWQSPIPTISGMVLVYHFPEPLYAYRIYKGVEGHLLNRFILFKSYKDNKGYHHINVFEGTYNECYEYAQGIAHNKLRCKRYGYGLTDNKTTLRRNITTTNKVVEPTKEDEQNAHKRIRREARLRRVFPATTATYSPFVHTQVGEACIAQLSIEATRADLERSKIKERKKMIHWRFQELRRKRDLANIFAQYGYSV